MLKVRYILETLRRQQGLFEPYVLSSAEKAFIRKYEGEENAGVHEALQRSVVVAIAHDSTFRCPAKEIVEKKKGSVVLPPVPFPEVKADDVCSGSPSAVVHAYLRPRMQIPTYSAATLIIGFNL